MYTRKSNSGHEIEWEPEDEEAAAKALVAVEGTGVTTEAEAKGDPLDLDDELARTVQERYRELVAEKEASN